MLALLKTDLMNKIWLPIVILLLSCQDKEQKTDLEFKVELRKPLSEISGLKADGNDVWAITDKPRATAYKIDLKGKVIQEVNVPDWQAIDVEAVTSDKDFVYIGDVGDNDGDREERQIIKFAKATLGTEREVEAKGELIKFRFAGAETVEKKKKNNFDCESLLSFGDSLYLFTKRREDQLTELFVIPKAAGTYEARSLGTFNCKGLITDASISSDGKEVAICGYNKGHKYPFIVLFKGFQGNDFFAGANERIDLADKPWEWQIESLTYTEDGKLYFACEETKEVQSTMYGIKRENLHKLNKK
jgi:hypothetical protein